MTEQTSRNYVDQISEKLRDLFWSIRQRLGLSITKRINGVSAEFYPDKHVISCHEFESERECLSDVLDELKDGDVFYDIGANVGIYSCFVSQLTQDIHVYAFDPSPPAQKLLKKNIQMNQADVERVQIAFLDEDRPIQFHVDQEDSLSRRSSLSTRSDVRQRKTITVKGKRMDTVIQTSNLPLPDVVKIDVEGAEMGVLRGMGTVLSNVRLIYCEVHHHQIDKFGSSREEIVRRLDSAGFDFETMYRRNETELIKAQNCTIE